LKQVLKNQKEKKNLYSLMGKIYLKKDLLLQQGKNKNKTKRLPHYGHILAGTMKDIVTRYAHQTGHHVERRFGWDCHGLPIEFEIGN
jgi:hypothetical protein